MRSLNLDHLTDRQKLTLTGCSAAVFDQLKTILLNHACRSGRPPRYPLSQQLCLTLFKLHNNLSYRVTEAIKGIDAVTASRIVNCVTTCLERAAVKDRSRPIFLVVDATVTQCGAKHPRFTSGHKHYKGVKTRVVCDEARIIRHVSQPGPATVHDKTIWDHERQNILAIKAPFIVADKAYAGACAKQAVIRPSKRNETAYRSDPDRAKHENRLISALRVRIEHVIGSLKRYKILAERFPLALHRFHACMLAVALIHNMQMDSKVSPEL